jgi:serine/threonine protein phosphatase PrpC
MEDDFFVSKDGTFAAVYDGHGGAAVSKYLRQNLHAQVRHREGPPQAQWKPDRAELILSVVWQFLSALPDEDKSNVSDDVVMEALAQAFKVVDGNVMKVRPHQPHGFIHPVSVCKIRILGGLQVRHWSYMGSTAVVVVVQYYQKTNVASIISANVGDSRAVLSRKGRAVELTKVGGQTHTQPDDRIWSGPRSGVAESAMIECVEPRKPELTCEF